MAQPQSKPSFASGLLARFNASTKAAQENARKALVAKAELRKREEQRKAEQNKQQISNEVDKIMKRNLPMLRAKSKTTRRKAAATSNPRDRNRTEKIAVPIRKPRPQRSGPPKPLPGMEFVVRKTERKTIKVPHSSDYSDMFGEQYLMGVDLDVTKQMAKKTAEAAKENAVILKEKEQRRKQKVREAEEITRQENELRAKGLLTEKRKRKIKCAASAKDWVAVDAPAPVGTRLRDLVTRPLAADSTPKPRSDKDVEKPDIKVSQREIELKKRQLRQRVLAMSGGGGASSNGSAKETKKRARDDSDDIVSPKRSRRTYSDDEDEPVRARVGRGRRRIDRPRRGERRYSRERGSNSEDWSDDGGDDDDDEEDFFGIEALEREEEESRRIAEQEDKMERKKELKRKKDKERRRREFESRHGY